MAQDRERHADLIRRGLASAPAPRVTFDVLADRYLSVYATEANPRPWIVSQIKHLRALGSKLLSEITAEHIEQLLAVKSATLSEGYLEHLRTRLRAMFNAAK